MPDIGPASEPSRAPAPTAPPVGPSGSTMENTSRGFTRIENAVVGKIAGLAAREISGVHSLGDGTARMVGAIRESFAGSASNIMPGISVEVGELQAAVDVSIIAEYGVAIHELADAIRGNIINSIEKMTGLEVTEVNVTVHDVHLDLGSDEDELSMPPGADQPPRVH